MSLLRGAKSWPKRPSVLRTRPITLALMGAKGAVLLDRAQESVALDRALPKLDLLTSAGFQIESECVAPAVDLPADIELIRQEPSSIVLRVLRQKRKADGG